ncbi:methylmalonyl-CoA mutase family protein [Kineosporia succinea]|uniref:Methylmalonyl-CoA mutase n=1 Tax=Kineosporia succinea TaxID=84632 RepID=A0ABT9P477_9ACTN|nr:methylmalonyl-CoA mutase family protein [Kineosporia succinea]MDP9827500.1 methylmalonyl-CoA mutase [Kineosporia succinea]
MPQPPDDLALAALFEPAVAGQWPQLVASALVKARRLDPDDDPARALELLSSTTYDGITVRPLYTADDATTDASVGIPGVSPFVRGTSRRTPSGWDVRQQHPHHPDPAVTHEAVMADLENGVTSLWLSDPAPGSLARVLDGVLFDVAPVALDAGRHTEALADELLTVLGDAPDARGNLGADPIGLRARLGAPADLGVLGRLARRSPLRAVTVDATGYHDAGGSDAQELGASIATGLAYLRALTDAGLDIGAAFGQLEFRYAANADQFLVIAKLRAARRLWARVAEVCGVSGAEGGQRQHVVTSSAMMTRRDPWVNLLRTTLAVFGAGAGGADSITVQPFDAAIGRPDAFSRRIARNTSSLLVMESHLARVTDPAGGSWYVERLTDDLANAAWDQFTAIEGQGGMLATLESGRFAAEIDEVWQQRARNLATRHDPLTGVSEFPLLDEISVVREPWPERPPRAEGALPVHRYAEEYEALRDAADACPERPRVFLATIGPVAVHTARASFAAGLFQAGGLATPSAADGVSFEDSGATVACLASSDKVYAEQAEAVARELKEAGARHVLLAGRPGDYAGVDGYVFTGVDALAVLRDLHRRIGVV